jgi:hypothetical protein
MGDILMSEALLARLMAMVVDLSASKGAAAPAIIQSVEVTDLQASITAAADGNRGLSIPAGDYVIEQPITISKPVTLEFAPRAKVRLKPGVYGDMFRIQSGGVNIYGGEFDFAGNAGVGEASIFAVDEGLDGLSLREATLRGATWGCVASKSAMTIESCKFYDNAAGDILMSGSAAPMSGGRVRGNYFSCPAGNWEAINVVNLSGGTQLFSDFIITDNVIDGHLDPSVPSCGIQLWANSNDGLIERPIVSNNVVRGFKIPISAAFCRNGTINGNTVYGGKQMNLEVGGEGNAVTGNTVNLGDSTPEGIGCSGWPRNNISGNTIIGGPPNFQQIWVAQAAGDMLIANNHFYHSGNVAGSAIRLWGPTGVTVRGNKINLAGSNAWGIYGSDVVDFTASGNDIRAGHTIELDNTSARALSDIDIRVNTLRGAVVKLVGTQGQNVTVEGAA